MTSSNGIPFPTIEQGNQTGMNYMLMQIVTNTADWQKVWANHTANDWPAPEVPNVDFEHEAVIVIVGRQHTDGSSNLTIESVSDQGENWVVTYRESSASGHGMACVMSRPYHFAKIPRTSKNFRFQRAEPSFGAFDPAELVK